MPGDYVSAVPGSGKTETLINKCYELMDEEGVENIVAITFTDRAAEELIERLKKRALREKKHELVRELPDSNVGTIHNFCSKLVRMYGPEIGVHWYFRVMDELESHNLLEKTVRKYIINIRNQKKVTEEGMLLDRLLDEFETDVEQIIKDCAQIMDQFKGYLEFMLMTKQGFFTSYSRMMFERDIGKEVSSKLKISILPGLLSLIDGIITTYQGIKQRSRLMDFDDLLLYAIRILEIKGEEISKKFRYILVDEFQDTDELQISIFEKFWEHGSSFFVVGDLNQSIYSFRGAHPSAQRRFSERISNQVFLKTNRRSGKNLISFFNNFFPALVEYEDMEGFSEVQGGAYCYIEEDKTSAVAEIIKERVRDGEKPGDIAVLSRTSGDFFNLKRYLKREGIDCVLISGESILKSQEGLDVLSLIRYLSDPGDSLSHVALLFSPFFGMTSSQVMKEKGKYGEVLSNRFGKYRELLKTERLDFVLGRILWGEGYVSKLQGLEDGNERASRLSRIMELVSSHVSRYGGDGYGTIEWLKNAMETKESGPMEDLLEDDTKVKIMTIHQSKGLEFNVVIIYDLRPGTDRERYYADEFTGLVIKRDREFLSSPSRKIISKSEKYNFSLKEESRILYVAFTRAKNELHLVLGEKDLKSENTAKKSEDLSSTLQKTLGLWKETDPASRKRLIERVGMIPSKISTTSPIQTSTPTQRTEKAMKREEVHMRMEDEEENMRAIEQFFLEKSETIKTRRLSDGKSRVTISDSGLKVFEDFPVSNNYFVRNGKIEFVL